MNTLQKFKRLDVDNKIFIITVVLQIIFFVTLTIMSIIKYDMSLFVLCGIGQLFIYLIGLMISSIASIFNDEK